MNSWKVFFASCWLWKHFPRKKMVQMLQEVVVSWWEVKWVWWMRQNFVTQLVQLLKWFLVRCAVMHCHAEELGPFCSLMLAVDLAIFGASHWFVEHTLSYNGFPRIQKTVDQMDSRPPNSGLFWCSFALGSALGFLLNPTMEMISTGCFIKFRFHCTILSRNGLLLLHRIREDSNLKWLFFFWCVVSSWSTRLWSFLTFPICFSCWMTLEWLMLNYLAIFCVVIRGSASMIPSTRHCQLLMVSHWTAYLQGSCLLCKTSRTTTVLYVC